MAGSLKKNLEKVNKAVQKELSANPCLTQPTVIAVSKKQPIEKIKTLYDLGLIDFGENYLQEALGKIELLKDLSLRWHFIGNIQSKKIKELVGHFYLIQTVSRLSEAEKIAKVAKEKKISQKILVQVNIADEDSKQGFPLDKILVEAKKINQLENLELIGLMVFPPLCEEDKDSLIWFEKAHQLFLKLQTEIGVHFIHLSMGTSHDFHLATRKGATYIRIGESLLGPRS